MSGGLLLVKLEDDEDTELDEEGEDEIEEKKEHYKRLEDASKKRYRDELETRIAKE